MFAQVARQAIYDKKQRVIAYELLFREGNNNCFPDVSPDEATSTILISSHLSVGLENLTNHKLIFINFHSDTLIKRFPTSLDVDKVVIEIVETVDITDELIDACSRISKLGYKLALDDYDFDPKWDPLLELCHYVKIEMKLINIHDYLFIDKLRDLQDQGKELIVERIEDLKEFEQLKEIGIDYFQGFFLSRPEMIKHKDISVSLNSVVQLLKLSLAESLDLKKINQIFETDVGLSFKLMRFINNPMNAKSQKIKSLSHALVYLGEQELKKFIAMLALANIKGNKPLELISVSLFRAEFCKMVTSELIGTRQNQDSFLLGLFSLIDALLDMSMDQVMQKLPFEQEIKDVLCEKQTSSQLKLAYQICIAFEQGNWQTIEHLSSQTDITIPSLFSHFYQAMKWADEMAASL